MACKTHISRPRAKTAVGVAGIGVTPASAIYGQKLGLLRQSAAKSRKRERPSVFGLIRYIGGLPSTDKNQYALGV